MTNADRIFENYENNGHYYKKTDRLRFDTSTYDITLNGTRIGYLEDQYIPIADTYKQFLVISLQFYYGKDKKYYDDLIDKANKYNFFVIFKNFVNIGFGSKPNKTVNNDEHLKVLMNLYKKTSGEHRNAMCFAEDYYDDYPDNRMYTKALYTMTQTIDGTVYKPNEILYFYANVEGKVIIHHFCYSIIAPVRYYDIEKLIDSGVTAITSYKMDNNISSFDYEFIDAIHCKRKKSYFDTPIIYQVNKNEKIKNFLEKEGL